ncbi:MAG TPA: hypothetical protein DD435_00715 [Cyanobacteria bacterium UBA8530]|nr:hypothetical protein [Cyanobacteria bacterium UBA8530]
MKEPSEKERELLREKILGLGERSLRKTYFAESQRRLRELTRFKNLLDHSNDIIFLVELPSSRLVDLNLSSSRLGFSPEELLKLTLKDLLIPSGYKKVHHFFLQASPGKEKNQKKISSKLKSKEGKEIPVEMTLSIDTFERETYCVVVARDISDRERLEKERALMRIEKERIRALKNADRLKDEFLSIISHELRNPLNAIMGFGSILDDELLGPLNPKQHELLSKLLHSSDRMLSLINDLLDFAKMRAGKFQISFHPTSYPPLVEEAVHLMEPQARAKGISIETSIDVPGDFFSLDGERIVQVLLNLLSNSIKCTPEGGKIFLRAFLEGDLLVTEVTDTGIGIAKEDLPRLFIPFQQLDMELTRKVSGTGLGLIISKGIVEAHGGKISAISPGLGKGATFTFSLPSKR